MIPTPKFYLTFIIFFCLFLPCASFSQLRTYQFEDLDSLQKVEQKNVLIFIHTDWCKYCQMMKSSTLKAKEVIDKMNKDYYFVSHDGEEKRDIFVGGKVFSYIPSGINTGIHQLTKEIATVDKNISYPTICIINHQKDIIFQHNAYLGIKEFMTILLLNANR